MTKFKISLIGTRGCQIETDYAIMQFSCKHVFSALISMTALKHLKLPCSWIPITVWIVLRNITPAMRTINLGLYGWLGCITLETYVSQFHTWLSTGIPDGQPKTLLMLFPAGYPLLNFAATTAGLLQFAFIMLNVCCLDCGDEGQRLARSGCHPGVLACNDQASRALYHPQVLSGSQSVRLSELCFCTH